LTINLVFLFIFDYDYHLYKQLVMTHLTIDNKKYVLIPEENYHELQKNAALKREPEKTFSIEEARIYSKKLIRKWASEK
jgi:hypothetical protein